jgi:enoyl-CoA hydratase/carnithine racemase
VADPAYREIRYEIRDSVLTITLDRPDKMNTVTFVMADELVDAFDRADADDDVRAVILTGAGRAFCAGADLSGGADVLNYDDAPSEEDGAGRVALRIHASLKPVIVAFNGAAVGAGATIPLAADIRLASTTAKFGFVFVRRGIVPEGASAWFLPRLVGMSRALDWNLTGRIFGAQEALDAGLVLALHEPEELLPAAEAIARDIAANTSPVAVALTRQMFWTLAAADHPMAAHNVDSVGVASRGRSADVVEGVQAFLEKRAPHFPDKVSTDLPGFHPWFPARSYDPPPTR